jgi:hypothetical protein
MRGHRWWDDLRFPATRAGVGASAPTYDTANVGYVFSDNPPSNQQLQFIAQLPHAWAEGSTISPHIHWALLDDDGAANEDVKWDLLYRWHNIGAAIPAAWTTLENTIDVSARLADVHELDGWTDIVGTGFTRSSIIECLVERDTADAADDHPHDVILKEFDIHFQIDSLGSWAEVGKWG